MMWSCAVYGCWSLTEAGRRNCERSKQSVDDIILKFSNPMTTGSSNTSTLQTAHYAYTCINNDDDEILLTSNFNKLWKVIEIL